MRFLTIPIVLLVASCASAPLSDSYDSPEALARAALAAIERRDVPSLQHLALDKDEFERHVWSELPAARPERNLTVNYVWGDLHQKSNATMHRTLAAHGGKKYELVDIRFLGDTTAYKSYRVQRETALTVKDAGGAERQVRLFGSVIEKGGRYKIFSYVIAD